MKRLLLMALAAAMLTPACGNNAGKETKLKYRRVQPYKPMLLI